jgi:hypothetical protein
MVKDWLLSTSQDHIKKGIQRVGRCSILHSTGTAGVVNMPKLAFASCRSRLGGRVAAYH